MNQRQFRRRAAHKPSRNWWARIRRIEKRNRLKILMNSTYGKFGSIRGRRPEVIIIDDYVTSTIPSAVIKSASIAEMLDAKKSILEVMGLDENATAEEIRRAYLMDEYRSGLDAVDSADDEPTGD